MIASIGCPAYKVFALNLAKKGRHMTSDPQHDGLD